VQKQRPAQYQGLYLVAADGKVLASHQNFKSDKTWPQEVLADLQPGVKAFGDIKPRAVEVADPLPNRGVGIRADGSTCLAVFLRYPIKGIPLRELPNPTIDSLVLTTEDLKELVPAKAAVGTEWTISEAVGRKFHRVLGPGDEDTMPRLHEVQSASFVGRVKSMEGSIASLTYEGTIAGSHETQSNKGKCRGEARLVGVGTCDVKTGRLLSLVWVFDGKYRPPKASDKQVLPYSGVVEWRRDHSTTEPSRPSLGGRP
jgi:hypothetical protein